MAAQHLLHSNASSASQTGQVLAMTLLHNSDLTEGTLTNAKMELISRAKTRAEEDRKKQEASKTIPIDKIQPLLGLVSSMKENLDAISAERSSLLATEQRRIKQIDDLKSNMYGLETSIRTAVDSLDEVHEVSIADLFKAPELDLKIDLEEAVSVVRNMQLASQSEVQTVSIQEFERVKSQLSSLLAAQNPGYQTQLQTPITKTRGYSDHRGRGARRGGGRPRSGVGSGRKLICYDCGSEEHLRGDVSCKEQSWLTKQRADRERNGATQQPGETRKPTEYFHRGPSQN